ncbi:hypothetical protein UY3_12315 [Chelonia mydas]|uniref:Uncharacterized protein n=1 Tax=Chelonia mydas TaxID=8469 RepID=M7B4W9_CHEMY|nr:hypothetical protein UY3_12315 [Chelonia mydas]
MILTDLKQRERRAGSGIQMGTTHLKKSPVTGKRPKLIRFHSLNIHVFLKIYGVKEENSLLDATVSSKQFRVRIKQYCFKQDYINVHIVKGYYFYWRGMVGETEGISYEQR